MSDETQERLRRCVEEFKTSFKKKHGLVRNEEPEEAPVPGFKD
jgi:hypothetical protein